MVIQIEAHYNQTIRVMGGNLPLQKSLFYHLASVTHTLSSTIVLVMSTSGPQGGVRTSGHVFCITVTRTGFF